jgi:hypothetical protein
MEEKTVFRKILLVLMLMLIALPALCVQGSQASEGIDFNTSEERIGGLRMGLTEKAANESIPCKPKKGKEILKGATGEHVQMWKYPDCGIELKMSAERKGGKKAVRSITTMSPSKLETGRGIHIGSTEEEVVKAYGRFRDLENDPEKDKNFIAGSVYDGMIFDFKDGRVVRIHLGSASE